jgi:predicted ATPase/DNA-binding SARP family transcriptional activator
MAKLEISLFGWFQVLMNGSPVTQFESVKVRALLAYLAAEADRPQSRESLATLLWPDWPQKSAMSNLRYALADLRKVIGDRDAQPPFLLVSRESLQINREANVLVDVIDFEAAINNQMPGVRDPQSAISDSQSTIKNLQSTISLYRGPFLEGFSLNDSPAFEEWLLAKREYFSQQMLKNLGQLAEWSIEQGEYEHAEGYARRQIELEPWREQAYQQLMRALSLKGERVQALAQFESLRKALQRELKVEPSEDTVALYQQIREGKLQARKKEAAGANEIAAVKEITGAEAIPARPVAEKARPVVVKPLHNLPQQLTSFIGREKEMAEVQALLANSPGRMVTLTGSGGSGKSRLAQMVAARMLDQFEHGVWLAELAHLADDTQVTRTVAAALGLRESGGLPSGEMLIDYVKNRRLLLVLDNCEHLLEACARLVKPLLRVSPGLVMLATSREALGVGGEACYQVPELAVPDPQSMPPLEQVTQSEAVRLFAERAALVRPDFQVTEQTASAVIEICYQLGGIPLAIELAAARVAALSVEQIAARLTDRFRLLTGGSRTALPHQQTLRASIDWSYEQLSEVERLLFGRLSVFSGGWTLEAAENVCAQDGIDPGEVLDILASLVKKSLVVFVGESPDSPGQEPRYRMLETIRQYARKKLVDQGGSEMLSRRHLVYFLRIAEQAEADFKGPRQRQWFDRLDIELDNLRLALENGLADGTLESYLAGLRLTTWVHFFDKADEGSEWLEKYMARPECPAAVPTQLQSRVWKAMGGFRFYQGNFSASYQARMQSLALYKQLGDAQGQVDMLWGLSYSAYFSGEGTKGFDYVNEAIAIAQQAGIYQQNQAQLMEIKGFWYGMVDMEVSKSCYAESLAAHEKEGDRLGSANPLRALGEIASEQGEYDLADYYLQKAVAISREMNSSFDLMYSLVVTGDHAHHVGRFKQMEACFQEAHAIAEKTGARAVFTWSTNHCGVAALRQGQLDRAVHLIGESLELAQKYGLNLLAYIACLAAVAADLGRGLQSARLVGMLEAQPSYLECIGPIPRQELARITSQLRAMLGDEAYEAALLEGKALTLEQAIQEAKDVADLCSA